MGGIEYAYPAAALALGLVLYWYSPGLYVGFVWWVWFLTPEVRRLIDYVQGWDPISPVMLSPYLVSTIAAFTLIRHFPKLQLVRFFPFVLVFMGLFYAYAVGVYRAGLFSATYQLLEWSIPVAFGFYLMVHWRRYPVYRRVVQRTFVLAVLVMGTYGLVQYFVLPAWDQYWMENAPITSIGYPEPLRVRVFSTLNSPAPFAMVMMAGLLLLFDKGGPLRWPAAAAGYASFLLSLVRSAWGAWFVALFFVLGQRSGHRSRILGTLAVVVVIALPLLTVGPVANAIEDRLETFSNIGQDTSFRDRIDFYAESAPQALLNVGGRGLGSTGLGTRLSSGTEEGGEYGSFDSGLLEIPLVMGWPGSMLYVSGLVLLLLRALRNDSGDAFAAITRGIVVAMLAQLVFDDTLNGLPGMLFWAFLALAIAAETNHSRGLSAGGHAGTFENARGDRLPIWGAGPRKRTAAKVSGRLRRFVRTPE